MKSLHFLTSLLCIACSAQLRDTPVEATTSLRQKAIFALSRGNTADARQFAQRALELSDGHDAESHLVLAILDFDACEPEAARTHLYAGNPAPADFPFMDLLQNVQEGLKRFGRVRIVVGPDGSTMLSTRIEPTRPPLDPEARKCMDALRRRLRENPLLLPADVLVPAGEYTLNGGPPFTVRPDETTSVVAPDGRGGR